MVLAQAVTASLITSVVPALILLVLPKAGVRPWVLRTMLAFAAGGLLGDVFLHMLPAMMGGHGHHDHDHDHHHDHGHSHGDHDHGHSHGDQMPMLLVLVGIISFFALDGVMKALRGGGGHSHGHSHGSPTAKKDKKNRDTPKGAHQGSETKAWLNLVADTAHNFTDGFVIGVAFLTQPATAHRTTLLILVHEVPHELGDFAVLASCGWNLRDIFSFQLVTALGNLSGCILVVLLGTAVEGTKYYIGPFAAGSFIYMALCSILSELNHDEEGDQVSTTMAVDDNKKLQKGSTSNLLGERLLHTVALSLGILSMYLVVWMEEYLGVHAH